MTRAMVVLEPDDVHVADVALGLAHWGTGRTETERAVYLLGKLILGVKAACAAATDEDRTDALRFTLSYVRAHEKLVETSREALAGETGAAVPAAAAPASAPADLEGEH